MENLAVDGDFMKNLASGSASNVITLCILGCFYVILKKCNFRHSKCTSCCFSFESDNIKTKRSKNVDEIKKELESEV